MSVTYEGRQGGGVYSSEYKISTQFWGRGQNREGGDDFAANSNLATTSNLGLVFGLPEKLIDSHLPFLAASCFKPETLQEYAIYLVPELKLQWPAGNYNFWALQPLQQMWRHLSIAVVAHETVVQRLRSNRWRFNFEMAGRGGQINFLWKVAMIITITKTSILII